MSKTIFAFAVGTQSGQVTIMVTHPVASPGLAPDCKFILALKPTPECAPTVVVPSQNVMAS